MQILIIIAIVAAILIFRFVIIDRLDRSRIQDYFAERGNTNIDVMWSPFESGWFFEKGERYYRVTYSDRNGSTYGAVCKTSLFTGVFIKDEVMYRNNSPQPHLQKHENELDRLKRENEELRRKLSSREDA